MKRKALRVMIDGVDYDLDPDEVKMKGPARASLTVQMDEETRAKFEEDLYRWLLETGQWKHVGQA